jgi:hypothetical protein
MRTLNGVVNAPLPTPLRLNPSVVATFLIIFAAPLQSLLMYQLFAVLYKPRLTLFPDSFHPLGFSPNAGRGSESIKEALEV